MAINSYKNCLYNIVNWEWNILKNLKRKRRRNFLLRGSFAIFCLTSIIFYIFLPPFILGSLLNAIGFPLIIIDWTKLTSLLWVFLINPMHCFKGKS